MHAFSSFFWVIRIIYSACIGFMWQGAECGGEGRCTARVGSLRRAIQRDEGSTEPSAKSCTWVGLIPNISTDWGMNGLKTALWRTWGYWWMRNELVICAFNTGSQSHPRLHQKEQGQPVKKGVSPTLLCPSKTLAGVLCWALGAPERCGAVNRGKWPQVWSNSPMMVFWDFLLLLVLFSLKTTLGKLYRGLSILSIIKGTYFSSPGDILSFFNIYGTNQSDKDAMIFYIQNIL